MNYDQEAERYERELAEALPRHVRCQVLDQEAASAAGYGIYELMASDSFVILLGVTLEYGKSFVCSHAICPGIYQDWTRVFMQNVSPILGRVILRKGGNG